MSDQCDFCGLHIENALTLFTACYWTKKFWYDIKLFLLEFSHPLPISRLQILFGVHDEPCDSVSNTAILLGKRVIWASKFKKVKPNLTYFKKSLKDYLVILCYCYDMKNTSSTFFDQWGDIYRAVAADQDVPRPELSRGDVRPDGEPQQVGQVLHCLLRQEPEHADQAQALLLLPL